MNTVGYLYDPLFLMHDLPGHPESAVRLSSLMKFLQNAAVLEKCRSLTFEAASNEVIGKVHAPRYVRALEQTVIAFLADYGIAGKPIAGLTGVWVDTPDGEAKIAAIGVRVNVKAVTMHGIGLNLNPDLGYFSGIIPCGIQDRGVTSLQALLGKPVDEADAKTRFVRMFCAQFGIDSVIWKEVSYDGSA